MFTDRIEARHEILAMANRVIRERRGTDYGERILYMRHLQEAVSILRSNGAADAHVLTRAGFNPRTT